MKHLLILLCLPPVLWACSNPTIERTLDAPPRALGWDLRTDSWRTDPAWYDGQAEKLTYRATRTIYGKLRSYQATGYTNKQFMDRGTTTKSAGSGSARETEVFKHHWSERIETEAYDYDFSTVAFVSTEDLSLFKLTAGTQEDCGTSFKQFWREGRRVAYFESVYFPGAGMHEGYLSETDVRFEDALPLVLRDFPFATQDAVRIRLIRSQKSTKRVPLEPIDRILMPRGEVQLDLPLGPMAAQRVDLVVPETSAIEASYWFAADGSAPLLHALVRYAGPGGVTYELESRERTAYWAR